ncbi:MAG: KTSC domain-containing protein [Caldilineaceae bacterium SB0670_bin_27]|uniref:KTSC domain-containing protein n=1 Tax=Caldilineaceae bacterium SB0664_bin_27 TaxID=2605260 RepID=A0A6B0YWD3_9CHLR|nr:KTSC domain-containing protein [Caldilineaceae bacterium SB0664_bin_27]MYJ78613.1 KTSC domain-containing protein [Caldilineaceae bacterium SB0670_bin_27]
MDRHQVASSNIGGIGYDIATQTLEVEFLSGWVYQYYGVPEFLYQRIMQASSKGQFLNQYIKNAYPYSRVG